MSILEEAFDLKEYMVSQRNYFHAHPELGLQEFNTCKHIEEELDKAGIKYFRVGETNVIAIIDTLKPGKTVFLRADIDALPITEKNNVPYKSQNPGVMHACGHDGHAAYLLGTARLLLKHKDQLSGKIILAFQAAEEIGRGAREIIEEGILDDVDYTFCIHFASELDAGTYGIRSGADMASCDRFKIKIKGKSAHITTPHSGSDALFIGSLVVSQLQTVVSRLINPVEGGLIGVGRFNAGTTYNIIAGDAEIEGTIRAFSNESRLKLIQAVRTIADNIAQEYGAVAEVEITDICDPLTNDAEVTETVIAAAKKIVKDEAVITTIDKRFMSDNFADYSRKAPGTYVHVGSRDSAETGVAHHNEYFDMSQDCCSYAAALALQTVIMLLNS